MQSVDNHPKLRVYLRTIHHHGVNDRTFFSAMLRARVLYLEAKDISGKHQTFFSRRPPLPPSISDAVGRRTVVFFRTVRVFFTVIKKLGVSENNFWSFNCRFSLYRVVNSIGIHSP